MMELTSVTDLRTISVQYAQSLLQADKTLQDVQNITSRWPKNADADAHFLHPLHHSMNEHLQNISDHLNTVQYDEVADEEDQVEHKRDSEDESDDEVRLNIVINLAPRSNVHPIAVSRSGQGRIDNRAQVRRSCFQSWRFEDYREGTRGLTAGPRHSFPTPTENQSSHDNNQNPSLNSNRPAETSSCTIRLLLALLYICILKKRKVPIHYPPTMHTKT